MQAVVCTQYGAPEDLRLEEVEKPTPSDDEVLVEVHAASVNSWDWDLVRGRPYLTRLEGLTRPKYKILGADIAGLVEAVGSAVTRFKPGDEVFGDISGSGWGGFAEYVCARESVLAHKPTGMTFEQAASVPQAGVLALQGLRYGGQIGPGQKVLLNGAGGGVGTFAAQIAKSYGAEVTGVDSAPKLDMLRSIGVDHVIDYRQQDFTRNGQQYDRILDVVASRSVSDYKRALTPNGVLVLIGGTTPAILKVVTLGSLASLTSGRKMGLMLHRPNPADLDTLAEFIQSGAVKPVIDRCFALGETPQAIRYLGDGHAHGKVVITIASSSQT